MKKEKRTEKFTVVKEASQLHQGSRSAVEKKKEKQKRSSRVEVKSEKSSYGKKDV